MKPVKIVVLGGSGVATPLLAAALADTPGRTRPIELVLVGRSKDKLGKVTEVAKIYSSKDPLLEVSCQTNLPEALVGADIVLNQVRVGGLEARVFDETFPQQIGLAGEETVGPGGFANATRTIPVVLEYAHQIEETCPNALLITFANPSSLVQYAITRYTRLLTIGLCDIPVTMHHRVAAAAGITPDQIRIDYLGMHHFGWIVDVWQGRQSILSKVLEHAEIAAPEIDPLITRAIGAVPSPYMSYIFHPEMMLAKKVGKRTRAEELIELQDDLLREFDTSIATGQKPVGINRRNAGWYESIIAPVMISIIEQRMQSHIVNTTNGQTIPWLPPEAVIESPAFFNHGRPIQLATQVPPPDVQAFVQANCAYEMLAVEAIVERDQAKALRALMLNPIIRTYERAARTIELAWHNL